MTRANRKRRKDRLEAARRLASHTEVQWRRMVEICGRACLICRRLETPNRVFLTRDHIVPIAEGGSDGIENIQVLCHRCNARKRDRGAVDLRPAQWREAMEGSR